jgi:glycosyltransferase involved in cell wall biosynthesis
MSRDAVKGLNLHLYPSTIVYESRMLKVTKSLRDAGIFNEIHLVGMHATGLREHEQLDAGRHVWRVPLRKPPPIPKMRGALKSLQWASKIIRRYYKKDVSVVHCHSLWDLPIGVFMKLTRRNVKLVYDAHELETERNGLAGLKKRLAKVRERALIRFVDQVLVVSESIAEWYRQRYKNVSVTVVKNIPYNNQPSACLDRRSVFRDKFDIKDGIIFLYQGALMKGRGIDLLLSAFSKAGGGKHIVFMGYGSYEQKIKEFAALHKNIHFHEAVSPDEVLAHTAGADVGVCLIENVCLSYYYCLPNKLYEYMLSGMPVIVSGFPEMTRLVEELGNGWQTPLEEDRLVALIEQIDKRAIEAKRLNSIKARAKIGWHLEEKKLMGVYQALL